MARTLLAGERTLIGSAHAGHHVKVEVRNPSDTAWVDLSAAYLISGDVGEDRDTPVLTARINLRRKDAQSIAPLVSGSTMNRTDASAYAPLLNLGVKVRLSFAVTAYGTAPTTEWREMLLGRIDTIDFDADPMTVGCSGLGAWLMDTQIETPTKQYGTYPTGTAMETILQQIVNDNHSGKLTVSEETLYTPTSPNFLVTDYRQSREMKVLEALRNVALSIGWDVRFRYDASHSYRLTFMDPGRARTTVDDTLGPTEYHNVTKAALALANIRNAGKVSYRDAATGAWATVSNATTGTLGTAIVNSQSKYGRRYFELESSANITDATAAQTLIDRVCYDLCDSDFEHSVETLGFWHVQLYDRHTLTANGDHYDQDQTLAVVGYRHAFDGATIVTTIQYAGKVVGAYREWLERIAPPSAETVSAPVAVPKVAEDGASATLSITVTDPQSRFRAIEYFAADAYTPTPAMNLAQGTGGWTAASITTTVGVTDTTYAFPAVTLSEKQPKKIAWRVWADLGAGTQVVDGGVERFAVGGRPMQPEISYEIRADGTLDVFVRGDSDTEILKIVVGPSSASDATVDAATLSQGSSGAPQRSATFLAAKALVAGEKFYITAKAYNTRIAATTADQGSAVVYVTDQWLGPSESKATVSVGSIVATQNKVTLGTLTFGALTSYVEVYVREFSADPGSSASAYPLGHAAPMTPLYAGVPSLDIPAMTPSNWVVVTLVAFDALNRMGTANATTATGVASGMVTLRIQLAAAPPAAPNAPTLAAPTAVGSPQTTARLSFTTPATMSGLSAIKIYRGDGTYITQIGVSSPSTVYTYDDTGRTQGQTYTYYGVGVNATTGATSAATATVSITMPTTTSATLVPAPSVTVSGYSRTVYADGAFTITITPAAGGPSNVTWHVEHSSSGGGVGFAEILATSATTCYDTNHPVSSLDSTSHTHWIRVYGTTTDAGWSSTPNYSAEKTCTIPSADDPHVIGKP